MTSWGHRIALLFALALALCAGQNYNGIYLGEDVSASEPASIAVKIDQHAVVTAYMGAVVPGLYDRHGAPVHITGIRLSK